MQGNIIWYYLSQAVPSEVVRTMVLVKCFISHCFVCVSAEWPALHHPPICGGPYVCAAFLVPPSQPAFTRAQRPSAAENHPEVPDCYDPPASLQQPGREASGDQDRSGQLLSAAQLEPATGLSAGGYPGLGG